MTWDFPVKLGDLAWLTSLLLSSISFKVQNPDSFLSTLRHLHKSLPRVGQVLPPKLPVWSCPQSPRRRRPWGPVHPGPVLFGFLLTSFWL